MIKARAKVKQSVKHNIKEGSINAQIRLNNKWQRRDLNPRTKAYESVASNDTLT